MTYYNSDAAYYAVAGRDIMRGNILLDGWYGASNNLYFLAILYGVFGQIFGYSLNLIPIVSAFLWACLLTLISYVILNLYSKESGYICVIRVCLALALCFSSCFFSQNERIYAGAHFDVILIGIFYIWVISEEIELRKNHTPQLAVASVLLILALWSDGLTRIFIVLPVLVGLIFNLLFVAADRQRKNYCIKHLVLAITLLVTSEIILKILQSTGKMITFWPASGVDIPEWTELFSKIAYFIKSVLYVFNCDVFGHHIGAGSAVLIFRGMVLFLLLFGLWLSLNKIVRNIFNHFLLVCIGIVSLVVVFTLPGGDTSTGPEWTSRLMYCFYIAIVLLFAQIDWERMVALLQVKVGKKVLLSLGIAAMCLMTASNLSVLRVKEDYVNDVCNPFFKIANVLMERGLTRGYGTYWLSSVVTLASEFQTDVRPVLGQNLSSFLWLSKSTRSWDYANFMLVDGSMWGEVTEESIIDCIGIPAEKVQVEEITILIWDKNIMPYINNSGYDGRTISAWWELENGQTEKKIEATSNHFASSFAIGEDGYYTSAGEGYLIYGPYKAMSEGVYDVTFEYDYDGTLEKGAVLGLVDVYSGTQKAEYTSCPAVAGESSVTLKNVRVFPECPDFETRFYAQVPDITMQRIVIKRTGI